MTLEEQDLEQSARRHADTLLSDPCAGNQISALLYGRESRPRWFATWPYLRLKGLAQRMYGEWTLTPTGERVKAILKEAQR